MKNLSNIFKDLPRKMVKSAQDSKVCLEQGQTILMLNVAAFWQCDAV